MSAPGRRVATGRLRVDAARAVAKLREYQLLERRLWILEALRGGVGAGAEALWVDADADDVWVAWNGPPPAEADLGALLDELVSPAVDPKRRWARLLATAVNTALGEGTRWVDVWRLDGESATCFRYAPALLEERDQDDRALRPVRREGERPDAPVVPERGVLLQVRRRFGVDVMGRWLTLGDAPEVALLREVGAGARSRVPLTVEAKPLERDADVLVSVELGERARMVLLRPSGGGPRPFLCRWLELGVPLSATSPLDDPPQSLTRAVPAALLYDAERLPTNAARSEVRLDQEGLAFVSSRAVSVGLQDLAKAAAEAYEESADDDALAERHGALRDAILAWIGAYAGDLRWRSRLSTLPGYLRPLLQLRLARNAVGRWVKLGELEDGPVLRAGEPEEEDLEPWLRRVLWMPPGDPTAYLFAGHTPPHPRRKLRAANRALAARRVWLRHEPRPPRIPDAPGQWLSVRFGKGEARGRSAIPLQRVARSFTGEVCLLDPSTVPPSHAGVGQVTLTLGGRPLAQVRLVSPIPYEAVVDSALLKPTADYRDAKADTIYENAVEAAHLFSLRAVELVLGRVMSSERSLPASARVRGDTPPEAHLDALRRSVVRVVEALDLDRKQIVSQLRGPFRDAPLFDVADEGERERLSLRDLAWRFEHEDAIILPRSPELPGGRPVPLDPVAGALLRRRFPNKPVHEYDASLASRRPAMDERSILSAVWRPEWPLLLVDLGDVRGAVALGGRTSTLHRLHRGVRIDQVTFEAAYEPCKIAMDDDRIIPTPRWDGVVLQPDLEENLGRFEQAICRALVDALAGDEVGGLRMRGDLSKMVHVQDALLRAATHDSALDERRRQRLEQLPLVPTVGGEKLSLAELRVRDELAWVASHESHVNGLPPDLLVADERRAATLEELTGISARHAVTELERAHRAHRRNANRMIHQRQPERSTPRPGPLETWIQGKGIQGVVRLSPRGVPTIEVEVRIEGRPFMRVERPGPPLAAVVEIPTDRADEDFEGLREGVGDTIVAKVRRASGKLLEAVAETAPRLLHDHDQWGAVLDDWLGDNFLKQSKATRRTRDALLEAAAFPTARGGHASIDEASSAKQVRVCEPLGDWLGPAEGEEEHFLDSPILAVVEPHRSRIERLALGKKVYDLTRSMKRLQDSRRIEQGLAQRPTLQSVPATLKATFEELSGSSRRRWMIGEVGLVPSGQGSVEVYSAGQHVRSLPLELEPPVKIAIEASDLAEASDGRIPRSMQTHLDKLVRRLLKQKIVPTAVALPRWVDESLRRAFLLGEQLTRADIQGLPLFETTGNERVSLGELETQVERFGAVWATTATSYLERTLLPLDPERFALRLTPEELAALASRLLVVDATEELRLDEVARGNLAKPAVSSLELPARLKPLLLAEAFLDRKALQGHIGLLEGSAPEEAAEILVHRDMKPLGQVPPLPGWPIIAILDDPRLSPDRVHGAPVNDEAWGRVKRELTKAREAMWDQLVPLPPDDALAQLSVERSGDWGAARGRLWLSDVRHGGRVKTWFGRISQSMTPSVGRAGLPLRGELWVCVRRSGRYERAQKILLESFQRLCRRIEKDAAKGDPDACATILHGELVGAFEANDRLRAAELPGLGVSLEALAEAKARGLNEVRALFPSDPLVDTPAPIATVMRQAFPGWVLRGRKKAPPIEAATPEREPRPETRPPKKRKKRTKPKRKPHALDPLAAALAKTLRHVGVGAPVVVAPRRRRGLVRYDEKAQRLELSGAHPQLVALQAERVAGTVEVDRAMRLLVIHAVGVLDRALASVTASTHRSVTRTLLGQHPER